MHWRVESIITTSPKDTPERVLMNAQFGESSKQIAAYIEERVGKAGGQEVVLAPWARHGGQ